MEHAVNQPVHNAGEKKVVRSNLIAIILILAASFISVFGIYNTFTYNLYDMIVHIQDKKEMWANVAIAVIFLTVMGTVQTIYVKKLPFFKKMGLVLLVLAAVAAIGAIILYFTKSLLYPLVTFLVLGLTIYMFELVLMTLGLRGFFFFVALFSLFILYLFKKGVHDASVITTIAQTLLAIVFFLGAAYPRIKELLFHIGTRDNIDIPNSAVDHDVVDEAIGD